MEHPGLFPGVREYRDFQDSPETMHCSVCGSECTVERGVWVPWRKYQRVYGLKDIFTCPHNEEKWHSRAIMLLVERQRSRSPRLRELILLDVVDLLRANAIEYTPEV